jgi:hypothetical protein
MVCNHTEHTRFNNSVLLLPTLITSEGIENKTRFRVWNGLNFLLRLQINFQ